MNTEASEKVLSVIIPCYNEEGSILSLVQKVKEAPVKNKEIIIVDDCSTDGTREVLERDVRPLVDQIIYHKKNQGKGGAAGSTAVARNLFVVGSGELMLIENGQGTSVDGYFRPGDCHGITCHRITPPVPAGLPRW